MNHVRAALLPVVAVSTLLIAGCGQEKGVDAKNESVESVAEKVAASNIKPQPGRWQSSVKMEKIDMPGLPPQAKDAMAKQMATAHSFSSCLTPEQVNRPNGGFFAGGAEGCVYNSFTMADGKVEGDMTCDAGGRKQTMKMSGTYSPTSYDIKISSQSEVQPGMPMAMELAVTSSRAGECDGKEDITAKDAKEMEEWAKKAGK